MQPLALLVLFGLASYRITRLITKDTFPPVAKIRDQIVGPDQLKLAGGRWEWLGELLTCYWCAGAWVSGAVVAAYALTAGLAYPLLWWAAVAAVCSLTALTEEALEALATPVPRHAELR